MKALVSNKSYRQLSQSEQQRLLAVFAEQEDRDLMAVLSETLRMACLILHANFGWGMKRCSMFVAGFKRTFMNHAADIKAGLKNEHLDEQMREIFGESGFPDEFFASFLENWPSNVEKRESQ